MTYIGGQLAALRTMCPIFLQGMQVLSKWCCLRLEDPEIRCSWDHNTWPTQAIKALQIRAQYLVIIFEGTAMHSIDVQLSSKLLLA